MYYKWRVLKSKHSLLEVFKWEKLMVSLQSKTCSILTFLPDWAPHPVKVKFGWGNSEHFLQMLCIAQYHSMGRQDYIMMQSSKYLFTNLLKLLHSHHHPWIRLTSPAFSLLGKANTLDKYSPKSTKTTSYHTGLQTQANLLEGRNINESNEHIQMTSKIL